MKMTKILTYLALPLLMAACTTPQNITYFQDVDPATTAITLQSIPEIRIQPKDELSIIVSAQDQRLTNMFNLPYTPQQIGTTTNSNTARGVCGYTVCSDGTIDFPVIGRIEVAGKTREEVASYVKEQLVSRDLVKEPVVTVEFLNLSVSVLGEVSDPGRYNIDKDNYTIFDALGQAGDLTIYGERENVLVLRSEEGEQKAYTVDLCSAESLYSSPVYYLQQNDVVYVAPNNTRKRQGTAVGSTLLTPTFWISVGSFLISLAIFIRD